MVITESLPRFVDDPYDAQACADLATTYKAHGYYAGAIGLYIRATEHTQDLDLKSRCFFRAGQLLARMGHRETTALWMIHESLALKPENVEALVEVAQIHASKAVNDENNRDEWLQSYLWATTAQQASSSDSDRFGAQMARARAAWNLDRDDEARTLVQDMYTQSPPSWQWSNELIQLVREIGL